MSQILTANNLALHEICDQVFPAVANSMGTVIAAQHRESLSVEKDREQSLLSKDELELSAIESVLRMVTRNDMMPKLGKPIYSSTLYEKVNRATILLKNSNNINYPSFLMVSFDNNKEGSYHESIILNGILPLVSYYLSRVSA